MTPTPTTPRLQLAAKIDHTLLVANATGDDVDRLCQEAANARFASVCVNAMWVSRCAAQLAGTSVRVCTVVGFPLGASQSATKAYETTLARAEGATEFDMVIAVGALKGGDVTYVQADIAAVVAAAQGLTVKVILETSQLTDDEKRLACELATHAGAHFVKTSTGFGGGGATADDVRLMRRAAGPHVQIKASGGIRSLADAQAMLAAGADRLGTSQSLAIIAGLTTAEGAY